MPMTDRDAATLAEILTRLAVSREELRALLDPPRNEEGGAGEPGDYRSFPRSRTMQLLMSGRGIGTLGALAAGLLMARPALALRLLRMVPASADSTEPLLTAGKARTAA